LSSEDDVEVAGKESDVVLDIENFASKLLQSCPRKKMLPNEKDIS